MVHVQNLSVAKSDNIHYQLTNGINNRLYFRLLQLKILKFSSNRVFTHHAILISCTILKFKTIHIFTFIRFTHLFRVRIYKELCRRVNGEFLYNLYFSFPCTCWFLHTSTGLCSFYEKMSESTCPGFIPEFFSSTRLPARPKPSQWGQNRQVSPHSFWPISMEYAMVLFLPL